MPERINPIAGGIGWCRGAEGRYTLPEEVSVVVYPGNKRTVDCSKFNAPTATCEQGNLPCVWTLFDAREKKESRSISSNTAAGEVVFDNESGEIIKSPHLESGHKRVRLTYNEHQIMSLLTSSPGTVYTFDQLRESYQDEQNENPESHSVHIHLTRLRRKIGQETGDTTSIIETLPKRGVRLSLPLEKNLNT